MEIKCGMCKRKLGYVAAKQGTGKYFCTHCDVWIYYVINDGKVTYRIKRPGR